MEREKSGYVFARVASGLAIMLLTTCSFLAMRAMQEQPDGEIKQCEVGDDEAGDTDNAYAYMQTAADFGIESGTILLLKYYGNQYDALQLDGDDTWPKLLTRLKKIAEFRGNRQLELVSADGQKATSFLDIVGKLKDRFTLEYCDSDDQESGQRGE